MAGIWVRTDEGEDVAASIRHAVRTLQFVSDDPHSWKWIMLALHSALQGACICHLVTSASPFGAVTKRNAGEWLAYFEESRANPTIKAPKTQLMALPDLLKAVRKPRSAGDHSDGSDVAISSSDLVWLRRFHDEIRNQFVHFEPKGWAIELSGMPQLAALVARIIDQIAEKGYAFRHMEANSLNAMRANLLAMGQHMEAALR